MHITSMMSGRLARVCGFLLLLFVAIFGVFLWNVLKWRVIPRITPHGTLENQLSEAKSKIVVMESMAKMCFPGDTNASNLIDQLANAKVEIERLKMILRESDNFMIRRDLVRIVNLSEAWKSIVNHVSFVLFSFNESSQCLKGRLDSVEKNYLGAHIVVASSGNMSEKPASDKIDYVSSIQKEGKALEVLEAKVKTKYFLYLSSGVSISPHFTDQSIAWLFHALETVPEVDFVGGAVLSHERGVKYPVYEAPCHRLRLCNWTFSQTFEYRYSVGDMMICEETSVSFMGRTASLQKVGHFDPSLYVMATTDFFLRAKGKAAVGLRSEVFFLISQTCAQSTSDELKTRFMIKHGVFVLKDSMGREVRAEHLKNFNLSNDNTRVKYSQHNTYAKPYYLEGLKLHLETGADYLEDQNITYYIDDGVALGGLKFRGMLPWDSGDIDLYYVAPWRDVKLGLEEYCKKKGIVKSKVKTGWWYSCISLSPEDEYLEAVPSNKSTATRTINFKIAAWVNFGEGICRDLDTINFFRHIQGGGRKHISFPMTGDKKELLLFLAGDDSLGVNTMFEEGQEKANPDLYMYMYIHGRRYPVLRQLFQHFRKYYGIHYLEMQGHLTRKRLRCKIPGHHACVPAEFSTGPGGHWRDFYCQI